MRLKVIFNCVINEGIGDITGSPVREERYISVRNKNDAAAAAKKAAKALCEEFDSAGRYFCVYGFAIVFSKNKAEVHNCMIDNMID